MNQAEPPRRGGRPNRDEAIRLRHTIIAVATAMFLDQGYGATSIEAVARSAHVSKRTLYHRFRDKADLFGAVVHELVAGLRPAGAIDAVFAGPEIAEILRHVARLALRAALSPPAVALQRIILAEAARFPELAAAVAGEGSRREAIDALAALLQRERQAGRLGFDQPRFAAEQFLEMVVSLPRRRAMGLGEPMGEADLEVWGEQTVRLFLDGCRGGGGLD